jgi:hypothetical protein
MTPPRRTQTRGAERRSPGTSSGSWALELCLGKETAGTCKVFQFFLIKASTDISSFYKNSLGNTMGAPKLPLPGKDQCLPSAVLGVQGPQKVTPQTKSPRRGVQSFNCTVRLSVVSGCFLLGDVKHLPQFKPEV